MKPIISLLLTILISLLIFSCDKEPPSTFTTTINAKLKTDCILEVETSFYDSCETKMGSDTCELRYIGEKLIPTQLKQQFRSFCFNKDEEITFSNGQGEEIIFTVAGTAVWQTGSVKFHRQDTCITYCHDQEVANKHFTSENIKFYLQLGAYVDDYSNYDNIESELYIGFRFYETIQNSNGAFISVPTLNIALLDSFDEEIALDTSRYSFYPDILLNEKPFTNVYSRNERYLDYVIPFFNVEDGLIGFEDYNDVMWVRSL